MNRKRAGLVIIILTLICTGLWELWGREAIAYDSILVLKEDAAAGIIIEKEDMTTAKVENAPDGALTPKDIESLAGMRTAQYVAGRAPLMKEYFAPSLFYTGEDSQRAVLALPMDWLLSCPQTVRRGDTVTLCDGDMKVMDATVIHAKDSDGLEVISPDTERLEASETVSTVEIIGAEDELRELSALAGEGRKFTVLAKR